MLFSSVLFIYIFLPLVMAIYFVILRKKRKAQNIFLFLASLIFYGWGEPQFVFVMIFSIIMNWFCAIIIDRCLHNDRVKSKRIAKTILAVTIIFNLLILFVFKYLNFVADNIGVIIGKHIEILEISLPVGISFFTFQAVSYVIDVYRGNGVVQKNMLNVGLYIAFFPQLIAGPIVRYETVSDQIENRIETKEDFFKGYTRFLIGLSKKVLLANSFAIIADRVFNGLETGNITSVLNAWLGAICYTFQIYYDFSGYSDMAIGLGRIFGFHFMENFDYPYISKSITEFWRRWHISLGSWFRDYVYIPLGGSRVKKSRLILNLFTVWLLTGIWHGANWTFILWGLMYFCLLTIEKIIGFHKFDRKIIQKTFLWIYSMLFIVIGWIIFRSSSVKYAIQYIMMMFGKSGIICDGIFIENFRQIFLYVIIGAILCLPLNMKKRSILDTGKREQYHILTAIMFVVAMTLLTILSIASISSSSYNPFIYFNF